MNVTFKPSTANGTVTVPPSKSMAHRLLLSAGLSNGKSVIHNVALSDDIKATISCLEAAGAKCEINGETVFVDGVDASRLSFNGILNCGESGSTLRFFIPLALLTGQRCEFTGTQKLLSRPQVVYENICQRRGLKFKHGTDYIITNGKLFPDEYRLQGNVSSQFVSGLMFALPLLDGDSIISIIPPVESRPYIDMTKKALSLFGVYTNWVDEFTITVPGNQKYLPGETIVEGDYSNAAFLAAFNEIGGHVNLMGLDATSLQGDKVFIDDYRKLNEEKPHIDISDCPDLGPVLFAVAALKHGGVFTGTDRLRFKESDRISAMKEELIKFGIILDDRDNEVEIMNGRVHAPYSEVLSHNDHRIAMALSVILSKTGGTLVGAQCVSKSMPNFFDKIKYLGIEMEID